MNLFIEAFVENPIGQGFGICAMLVAFLGLLQKDDKNAIKIIIISSFLWIIHFYLMGVYSAMAMSTVGIIRLFLSLKYKKNIKVFYLIVATVIVTGIMTYENKLSLLPFIGSIFSAYGYFFAEGIRLRFFIFISSVFWLTFSLNVGSVGGAINEIISQLILIFVMYRLIRESEEGQIIAKKIVQFFKPKRVDAGRYTGILDFVTLVHMKIKNGAKKTFYYSKNKLIKLFNKNDKGRKNIIRLYKKPKIKNLNTSKQTNS